MAKSALLETLSVQLGDRLPSLLKPIPAELRSGLASFCGTKAGDAGPRFCDRALWSSAQNCLSLSGFNAELRRVEAGIEQLAHHR